MDVMYNIWADAVCFTYNMRWSTMWSPRHYSCKHCVSELWRTYHSQKLDRSIQDALNLNSLMKFLGISFEHTFLQIRVKFKDFRIMKTSKKILSCGSLSFIWVFRKLHLEHHYLEGVKRRRPGQRKAARSSSSVFHMCPLFSSNHANENK